jgi:predicted site-specific integrase-resolvase
LPGKRGINGTVAVVKGLKIGYARVSTDAQDLSAQLAALTELGVGTDRIYVDKGLTGTNRARPGPARSPRGMPGR